MRISETKAAASILAWADEEAHVALIPDTKGEVVYGQLKKIKADDNADVNDLNIHIVSNRGFTIDFPIGHLIHKMKKDQFWRYDWREVKPVRVG